MIARSLPPEIGVDWVTSTSKPQLSVVIPVYRSEATLEPLLERLVTVLNSLGRSFEIILVEDASPDGTWDKIETLVARYSQQIIAVQLMRNFGQHNALMCGFRHARGELVVTMDDDLQNPPEEIPKLIEKIERSDCDLVYGRYAEKEHAAYRNLGSTIVNCYFRYIFRSSVNVTSFRAIRRPLVEAILSNERPDIFLDGLFAWNTRRIGSVLVEHHPREFGRSTYSLAKLSTLAMNLFASFSVIPLNLISVTGFAITFLGLAYGVLLVGRVPFTTSGISLGETAIAIVLSLGGFQLLSIGFLGQYLGRFLLSANGQPQYRERKVLGRSDSDAVQNRSAEPFCQTKNAA